MANKVLEFNGE